MSNDSKVMWKRFGKGGKQCCFCSDERPVQKVYAYKDRMGEKNKERARGLLYRL